MLTQIKLTNFKCFQEETAFPLSKVNLLTGMNGQGKSTLLQSLLLMRQSIEQDERTTKLFLNGSFVNLGHFDDIKNTHISRDKPIIFDYYFTHDNRNAQIKYFFQENLANEMILNLMRIFFQDGDTTHQINRVSGQNYYVSDNEFEEFFQNSHKTYFYLSKLIPESDDQVGMPCPIFYPKYLDFSKIHYISVERLTPQDFYWKSVMFQRIVMTLLKALSGTGTSSKTLHHCLENTAFKSIPTLYKNVGARGEFTAHLLEKRKNDLVNDKLCLEKIPKTLLAQTEAWLQKIFDNFANLKITVSDFKANLVDIPQFNTNILELFFNTGTSTNCFKPTNVGFGYNYILPIIVSGLIVKEGEILIVENPEAHLHPKAQLQLALFFARVSSCGVQVFIESHSEHILNGIQMATQTENIEISTEDVSVLNFQDSKEEPVVQLPLEK